MNLIKNEIKNPFIEKYTNILNEATIDMMSFIDRTKIESKVEIESIFTLDSDSILANIINKLNKTKSSIKEYNSHLNTFSVSEEVINFLDNFKDKEIIPRYKKPIDILDL